MSAAEPGPALWTFAELAARPREPAGAAPWDWLPAAAGVFAGTVASADAPYPCDFGARAQRLGHNRASALDARPQAHLGVARLAATLRAFAVIARTGPTRQSLAVFCGPPRTPPVPLDVERQRFWTILTQLSDLDERCWPAAVPADPADPRWQWCFAGEAWFVFGLSPAYTARRSRAAGPCLTLVFQTGRVFAGIGGSTEAGRRAKRRIRGELSRYDAVAAHPHLGDVERSSQAKWRQYLLPDDQHIDPPDQCPFRPPASTGRPAPAKPKGDRHGAATRL